MKVKLRSRAACFDDLDNDGDIDAVILNARREPTILRNDSPSYCEPEARQSLTRNKLLVVSAPLIMRSSGQEGFPGILILPGDWP